LSNNELASKLQKLNNCYSAILYNIQDLGDKLGIFEQECLNQISALQNDIKQLNLVIKELETRSTKKSKE